MSVDVPHVYAGAYRGQKRASELIALIRIHFEGVLIKDVCH